MIGVFDVAGMFCGERIQKIVDVCRNVIRGAIAIGYYRSTRRNLKGNCPCGGVFVDFGEKVEVSRAWVVWSE